MRGVDLSDNLMGRMFEDKLDRCESEIDSFSQYDQGFIHDIRRRYTNRESDVEFGAPVWNPTAKQYNHLSQLAQRIR